MSKGPPLSRLPVMPSNGKADGGGRPYDAQLLGGGVEVELKSHRPIARQALIIGATWLDQQLIGGGKGLGDLGLGTRSFPGRTWIGRASRAACRPCAQPAGEPLSQFRSNPR